MTKKKALSACDVIRNDHDGIKKLLHKFNIAGESIEPVKLRKKA